MEWSVRFIITVQKGWWDKSRLGTVTAASLICQASGVWFIAASIWAEGFDRPRYRVICWLRVVVLLSKYVRDSPNIAIMIRITHLAIPSF